MQLSNEEININNIDSIDSIDSKYWGKHTWIFLNSIALTYNNKYKTDYINFLNQLQNILPCNKCREHFKKNLLTLKNSDLINKETFLNWLIGVRNSIYIEQKRPLITKKDTILEIFYSDNTQNNKYYYIIFLIIIMIIIIIIFVYIKN